MLRFLRCSILVVFLFAPVARAQDASDIDGDGILTVDEDANGNGMVDPGETDPLNADSDGGGESDGSEIRAGRNPLDQTDDMTFDRDGDGLTNGMEILLGTDPTKEDTDGDGLKDGVDPFPLEVAFRNDRDRDKVPDEWEQQHQLSTISRNDATEDPDNDGLTNAEEFMYDTDPHSADTDRDGVEDGTEVEAGADPTLNPCLAYYGDPHPLTDTVGHWSEKAVALLRGTSANGSAIVAGYEQEEGEPLFLPDRPISRFEFLKIALLSSCIAQREPGGDVHAFSDVPLAVRPHESDDQRQRRRIIYTASMFGIVEGYEDGAFRPDSPVTRAEAMTLLLRATRVSVLLEQQETPAPAFDDIDPNDWFAPGIAGAHVLGIVEGYEDGTFRPHSPITRAEAAVIVARTLLINPNVNAEILPGL